MRDIKNILISWKNASVLKRIGAEYPHESSVIQSAKNEINYRQYLNEEETNVVDDAVLKLQEANQEHYAVLTSFYLHGISCTKQARVLGRHTTEITKMLLAAESFVKGHIYDFFNNAA